MKSFARSAIRNRDAIHEKVETTISEVKETAAKVALGAGKAYVASKATAHERAASINPKVELPFPDFNGWEDT